MNKNIKIYMDLLKTEIRCAMICRQFIRTLYKEEGHKGIALMQRFDAHTSRAKNSIRLLRSIRGMKGAEA